MASFLGISHLNICELLNLKLYKKADIKII